MRSHVNVEGPGTALDVRDLTVVYGHGRHAHTAVDEVSLSIEPGRVLGLVGESGSGKSTVARAVMGLAPVAAGTIAIGDTVVGGRGRSARRQRARQVQLVFLDPYSSLNPRMRVGDIVAEPLALRTDVAPADRREEVAVLLGMVNLDPAHAQRLPGQLSGGQRQRVAIARALAVRPRLVIADEVTSALDVSVQAHVLNLLRHIQRTQGLALLFISHNLATVRYLADDIAVMRQGRIVEQAPAEELVTAPSHTYTRALLDAVPALRTA